MANKVAANATPCTNPGLDTRQACQVVLKPIVAALFPRVLFRVDGCPCFERHGVGEFPAIQQFAHPQDRQEQEADGIQRRNADQSAGGDGEERRRAGFLADSLSNTEGM